MNTAAYCPARESDGPAFVPVMIDLHQADLQTAADSAAKFARLARDARLSGDAQSWDFYMALTRGWRARYAALLKGETV